jgi:murein L,D-transpeptidase YcbB/YkuD
VSFLRNRFGAVAVGVLGFAAASGHAFATSETAPTTLAAVRTVAPLDANGLALSAAIKADLWFDDAVFDFYAARGFERVWDEDAARGALSDVVNSASAHALPRNHYLYVSTRGQRTPTSAALEELQAMRAFLTFAGDVSAGVLQPRVLDHEIHLFPERPQNATLLQALTRLGDPRDVVAEIQPSHPHYAGAQGMIVALNAVIDDGDWAPTVVEGGSLKLGMSGPRIATLRARLIAMGDMPTPVTAEFAEGAIAEGAVTQNVVSDVFDIALELGVMAFQRRHGLNDDGVAGRRTIAAANVSAAQRRDQAIATLERLRWMNKDLGAEHIIVNLADFRVNVIRHGAVVFDERVVVGKSRKHRTPEFSDMMTHLVLSPTWNVPRSIATKEILPELQANPNYLAEKNMELVGVGGAIPPEPLLADWSLYDQSSFPFRIKQRPGAGNALGRVKFMFPNQFSIYLHDTPSKRLFAKDARAFSHGCVRVRDPMQLARVLLAPKYVDPDATIERILAKGSEAYVNLAEPIPVHLTYRTAWVDDAGAMQFRADVYGRDALIRSALGELGVTGRPGS